MSNTDSSLSQLEYDTCKMNELCQIFTPDGVDQGNAYYDQTTYLFLADPSKLTDIAERFQATRLKLGKHLDTAYRHPDFQKECLRLLRLLLPAALADISESLADDFVHEDMVVFELSYGLDFTDSALRHFIDVAKVTGKQHRPKLLLRAPYWVYLVYDHAILLQYHRSELKLRFPCHDPSPAVLEHALILWDANPAGVYQYFVDAVAAAKLLV